jgi:hypothetical protein
MAIQMFTPLTPDLTYSGVGNLGGGISSNLWRDPPTYRLVNGLTIMFICIGLLSTAIMWFSLQTVNVHRL